MAQRDSVLHAPSPSLAPVLAAALGAVAALLLAAPAWVVAAAPVAAVALWSLLSTRRPGALSPQSTATRDAARELFETVVDTAPDAVVWFSDIGIIRYANRGARELFFDGKPAEGGNFLNLVGRAPAPLREALLGDSDRLFSVDVEGRNETYHVSKRLLTLDGEPQTILAVKHMTREISRREVDVLKRVVRVISHEVNNSLAPVSSLVHSARLIASNPGASEKLGRVFDTISERTTHLCSFLQGYAAVAKLPRPKAELVELERFAHQLSLLHPDIEVKATATGSGWFDRAQLEQVVINLVKNAREAGSETSAIVLEFELQPSGETMIEVLDRGPGFSDEALKSALLPLYTTKERGSGMGLALSREIVEAHNGSLALANRPDGGAVVRVHLPGRTVSPSNVTRSRLTLGR